jgi:hypothetical protein
MIANQYDDGTWFNVTDIDIDAPTPFVEVGWINRGSMYAKRFHTLAISSFWDRVEWRDKGNRVIPTPEFWRHIKM